MTFDDIDTWWVTYSQLVGAGSKSSISYALNNDPEAQESYKRLIITALGSTRHRDRIPPPSLDGRIMERAWLIEG